MIRRLLSSHWGRRICAPYSGFSKSVITDIVNTVSTRPLLRSNTETPSSPLRGSNAGKPILESSGLNDGPEQARM